MVFNWFRRQFGTSEASQQETRSEDPQVEQEKQVSEQPEAQPAASESTEEQSPAVADDYLSWAKAAYKNIQKQQQLSPEADPAATESPESPVGDQSVAQPAISDSPEVTEAAVPKADEATEIDATAQEDEDSVAPIDTAQSTGTAVTVELEEPATPETAGREETPLAATDVSEPSRDSRSTTRNSPDRYSSGGRMPPP
jgi:fused signal recognition particle receptor